jgi:hypothetical protein
MVKRVLLSLGGVFLLLALGVMAVRASPTDSNGSVDPPPVTVRCDQAALHFKTGNEIGQDYRVVLGLVSAPPLSLPQKTAIDPSSAPFRHWSKAGLAIRAQAAVVTVRVPKPWRDRARIIWGNASSPGTVLRFAPCPSTVETWGGYSGGFLLRSSSACVPLIFAVGQRHATLRFGVGREC